MTRLMRYFNNVLSSKKPFKFMASRLLWYSRLCRIFKIQCRHYTLRFFPTALSASMWLHPSDRDDDEIFFEAYLHAGDIVIDIGANIGTAALATAAMVGPKGKVFAFEPHPRIYKFMNANIRLNGHTNIETFNIALGECDSSLTLSNNYSDDQNRIQIDQRAGRKQMIEVKRLDTVLADRLRNIEQIALIKIDVEGFEKFVIDGAVKILSRCKCVYFESCDAHFNRYGYSTDDLLNKLSLLGFSVFKRLRCKLEPIGSPYRSENCENLVAFKF